MNEDYARQIARDWNETKADTGYRGFVTRFQIDLDYGRRFEVHAVGGRIHQELWIPAEDLDEFNGHILGRIEVVAAYAAGPTTPGVVAWMGRVTRRQLGPGAHGPELWIGRVAT